MDRRKEVRVTVENNTKGAATANVGLKVPAGWRVLPATQPVVARRGRGDDHRPLHRHAAGGAGARPARAEGRSDRRQGARPHRLRAVHPGLPGDRVPAHPAASQGDSGGDDGEGRRRRRRAGHQAWATSWASAIWCRRRSISSASRSTMIDADELAYGNLAKLRHDHARHPRLRAARGPEGLQPPPDQVRQRRRDADRPVQQDGGVQPGAVRPVSGAGQQQPRHRRNGAGADPREGAPRLHVSEPRSARTPGTAGCRSAGSTSSAKRTRNTPTSSSSRIRSNTTLG